MPRAKPRTRKAPAPAEPECRHGVCAAHPELHAALERFNGRMARIEDSLAHEAEVNGEEHAETEALIRAGQAATDAALRELGEKLTGACAAVAAKADAAHGRIDWWQTRATAVVIALVLVGAGWSWATSSTVVGAAQAIVNNHQATQRPTPQAARPPDAQIGQ